MSLIKLSKKILLIRHATNKVIMSLEWRKLKNFFKSLIKGNTKYTKSFSILLIFTYFHYFILFWGTIFWHRITETYLMIWYSLEYNIMKIFDYLTITSIINLKEVIVDSINYVGWELNLSIRPRKYYLHSFNKHKPVRET